MGLALVPNPFQPAEPAGDLARLRRFAPAFTAAMRRIGRDQGAVVRIDSVRLAAAYLDWRSMLPMHSPHRAAGVLLQALLRNAPLTMVMPAETPEGPARFWPEGHACVTWCLDLRRMLSGGGGPGAAFLDLRTWWSFRENFAEDSAVAVPFLELFAGDEPDWDRAGDQSACGPPQLRVVASEFVPLPPDTNVVIFDLGALSNADDLSVQAQCALLAHYGAALPEAEVRRRFLHRPVGLAMTHVAERTGRICPSGYIADLRRSEAKLLAGGLILSDGAAEIVAALSRRGVKVRIVARESALAATLAELRASFPTAEVVHGDIASGLEGLTDDICRTIAATTSPAVISAVIAAGGAALGVADRSDLRKELLAAGARQVLPVISNLTIAP